MWSVDFSQTDPTRFLSGSDDGTVRLWSLNDAVCPAALLLTAVLFVCMGAETFSPVGSVA